MSPTLNVNPTLFVIPCICDAKHIATNLALNTEQFYYVHTNCYNVHNNSLFIADDLKLSSNSFQINFVGIRKINLSWQPTIVMYKKSHHNLNSHCTISKYHMYKRSKPCSKIHLRINIHPRRLDTHIFHFTFPPSEEQETFLKLLFVPFLVIVPKTINVYRQWIVWAALNYTF